MMVLKLVWIFLILFFSFREAQAQGYRGIVPIEADCNKVEKQLEIRACQNPKVEFSDEKVKVEIYVLQQRCQELFQTRWNVAKGTVIGVIVYYKKPELLENFPLSVEKFDKSFSDIGVFYMNTDKTIEVATEAGLVVSVSYMPSRKKDKLSCDSGYIFRD